MQIEILSVLDIYPYMLVILLVYGFIKFYNSKFIIIAKILLVYCIAPLLMIAISIICNSKDIDTKLLSITVGLITCISFILRYRFRVFNVKSYSIAGKLSQILQDEYDFCIDISNDYKNYVLISSSNKMKVNFMIVNEQTMDITFSKVTNIVQYKKIKNRIKEYIKCTNLNTDIKKELLYFGIALMTIFFYLIIYN